MIFLTDKMIFLTGKNDWLGVLLSLPIYIINLCPPKAAR
jgi:hypothetical protein